MEDLLPHIIILGLYSTCLIIKDNNDNDDGVDNDDHHVPVVKYCAWVQFLAMVLLVIVILSLVRYTLLPSLDISIKSRLLTSEL